jgi:phosphomannomutase
MEHIFRAYDIRGVYPEELNEEIALKIGRGIGTFVKRDMDKGRVLIGYDIRTTSPAIHAAVLSGVVSTGLEVMDAGMGSFGQVLFSGYKAQADLTVFITASHLPPEYNGVKMYYGEGIGLEEENIIKIRDYVLSDDLLSCDWKDVKPVRTVDLRTQYQEKLMEWFKPDKQLKVAVDCGNGAASLSAPQIVEELGYDLIKVFCDPDPTFPNRSAEPDDESLGVLKETVVREGADLGIAFDGDGDRVVVVDDKGRTLTPDELAVVIGKHLVKDGDCVLANVESSMLIEEELEPIGARVKRIKVGHTFLTLEAKLENAVLGVEKSGHLIIPEYFLFDDAIVAPLYLAQILSRTETRLSSMKDELPVYLGKRLSFDSPDNVKFDQIEKLQSQFSQEYERVNTMDGVRVDFDDGWVLIRASNTAPIIRMTVEAKDETRIRTLIDEFSKHLE